MYLLTLLALSPLTYGATTLIPTTCFDDYSSLEEYFAYLYPWGSDHNGSARMVGNSSDHEYISVDSGTLTIVAKPVSGQPPTSGGQEINYLSGAIHSATSFTVEAGSGFDIQAEFQAPTATGTWPAFWLNGADTWPPEIDIAEWKGMYPLNFEGLRLMGIGTGDISFNTFNTSSEVQAHDIEYPSPDNFHTVKAEIRDEDGSNISVKFFLDGTEVTTQYGAEIINLQMEGSSGSPGPTTGLLLSASPISPHHTTITTTTTNISTNTPSIRSPAEMTLDDNPPGGSQSDLPRPAPSSPFGKYYPLHINPENIFPVDPITRTFCFFGTRGFHQKVEETVARRIENARVLIQRLPTQDELDAMVTHSSRSVAYERKGIWIGALIYAGISLPRWARTERWRTYVPPTGSMVQRLAAGFKAFNKAEPLVARQRTMLAVFKLMFSMIAGASVSGVMGVYTETKNTVSDPRLAQFMADLRNQNPEEVQKRKAAAIESRRRQMHQRRLEEVPAVGDGQGGLEKEQGYASGGVETDSPQTATAGRVYQAVQDRRPVVDSSESQSKGSYFFDDDDASPVAPEHRNTSLQDAAHPTTIDV
ncbi:conserved hypothetical protein [Aspergillus terreus NIH2624]|uniref:GH16 domain-containing protein n=1 Tax=Aspergillus terreus (strain NIH 2624 / FGSC A1156) TaxID=341663 RepID=Q0CJK4_ASPTN|nr:uncharacterized protein ATEG_06130 [Aspergillus terreus NIH2624]EAU33891.1 conserved hypothetical protein [Aspergillus terreus NIH2624]